MAISFVAAGAISNAASGNISPALPSGHTTNDILIVIAVSLDNVTHSVSGYTPIDTQKNNGTGLTTSVWWKRDGGSESAPTVSHTSGSGIVACVAAWRGCSKGTTPIGVNSAWLANASSTTCSSTGLTTNAGASQLIEVFGIASKESSFSSPSGSPTPVIEQSGPNTNSRPALCICDSNISATNTATGTRTVTAATAAVNNGIQFTFLPEDLGTATPTQGANTDTTAAGVLVQGTSAQTQGANTDSAAGGVLVQGSSSLNPGADTDSTAADVLVQGTAAPAQGAETLSADGTVTILDILGVLSTAQGSDTASATGVLLIAGDTSITQGGTAATATGGILIQGVDAIAQDADDLAAIGSAIVQAAAGLAQGIQTLIAFGGTPTEEINGFLDAAQNSAAHTVSGETLISATSTIIQTNMLSSRGKVNPWVPGAQNSNTNWSSGVQNMTVAWSPENDGTESIWTPDTPSDDL